MITDDQLNQMAIYFGIVTFTLIVVYHTISSSKNLLNPNRVKKVSGSQQFISNYMAVDLLTA